MSKEINNEKATSTTMTVEELLKKQMETYSNVTVRKLANSLELSYGKLLKASRAPEPGVPYDPEAINYKALAEVIGVDKILDANWEEMNSKEATNSTLAKDMEGFKVGDKVYIRRDNEKPYEIIHMTNTHIVIQQVETDTPQVWSNGTFLINGPVFEPRTKREKAAKPQVEKVKEPKVPGAKAAARAFATGSDERPWVD